MTSYIFDVDGTLTPSRGLIDLEFKAFFNTFCLTNGKIGRHLLTPLPQHYFLLECGLWQEKK